MCYWWLYWYDEFSESIIIFLDTNLLNIIIKNDIYFYWNLFSEIKFALAINHIYLWRVKQEIQFPAFV